LEQSCLDSYLPGVTAPDGKWMTVGTVKGNRNMHINIFQMEECFICWAKIYGEGCSNCTHYNEYCIDCCLLNPITDEEFRQILEGG
jgi:hypothetical protein